MKTIRCPYCGKAMRRPRRLICGPVTCRKCGKIFYIVSDRVFKYEDFEGCSP